MKICGPDDSIIAIPAISPTSYMAVVCMQFYDIVACYLCVGIRISWQGGIGGGAARAACSCCARSSAQSTALAPSYQFILLLLSFKPQFATTRPCSAVLLCLDLFRPRRRGRRPLGTRRRTGNGDVPRR